MSDYTKTVDFAAKDALPTGNAAKAAKGTEVDTEFENIAIAIATKYDSTDRGAASGIASLDGSGLILPTELPVATTTAAGALETATTGEAAALSVTDKILTPGVLDSGISAWAGANGGVVEHLNNLADPGDDRILYWNEGSNTTTWLDIGAGLTISGSVLSVFESNVDHDTLQNYVANEHIDMSTITITAGDGLSYSSGGSNLTADSTIDVDISSLADIEIPDLAAVDAIMVDDSGVLKRMEVQNMGVRVVPISVAQTFSLTDANRLQLLIGSTDRAWDIPTNATVAFNIGTVIYLGSRDDGEITISPSTSAVRLTSVLGTDVGPTAGDRTVLGVFRSVANDLTRSRVPFNATIAPPHAPPTDSSGTTTCAI